MDKPLLARCRRLLIVWNIKNFLRSSNLLLSVVSNYIPIYRYTKINKYGKLFWLLFMFNINLKNGKTKIGSEILQKERIGLEK